MPNRQRQTMKMKQKLSPQQLLLMRIIQQPITALSQEIKDEVERNPLLEITPDNGSMMESLPEQSPENAAPDTGVDTDDDDYSYRERVERDRNQDAHERVYVSEDSFGEYLLNQLSMYDLTPRQNNIAEELIGSIDGSGYLSRSIDLISNDLAFTQGIEVSPQEVEQVLAIVQQLDPPGICARNLQECLSIQLHRIRSNDVGVRCAIEVVDKCFDNFAKHNYEQIIQELGITTEQLQEAIRQIRLLNPKPGLGESESSHAHYIIPDFIVTCHDGQLQMHLNDGRLPQLQLSDYYQEMIESLTKGASRKDQDALQFLQEHRENALMLMETLRQRHTTMLNVMIVILRKQRKFFQTGDTADLQPLLQRDVAEITGYDLSTISRVVNSKYVQTEFGTIPLKDCFSQSIVNEEGEEIATEQVRQALLSIIEEEDKQNPLTDDEIAAKLKQQGFPVARRTVAKYRGILGIPICRLRRQLKTIIFVITLALSCLVQAQQPHKESYFDSILNARIREGQTKAQSDNKGVQKKNPKGKAQPQTANRGALEIHEPEPAQTAIDTILANGDEFIDLMYTATMPPPSQLWYGKNLSGSLVRLLTLSMDSLPDEISIQLIKGNEKFCFPIKNVKTSPYGWRWNRPHRGVDIRLNMGDPVHCAFNGVVRIARPMGAYGNLVVVRHYNGLETVYGHLSKINVKPMQIVAAGQVLGLGGSTGRSTGPHLHFEVRFQYEPFDPEWILDFSNYTLRTRRLYLDKSYFGIRKPKAGESLVYKADKSIVPEEQPKAAQPSKPVYAAIKKGETLEAFAKRNFTTVDKINSLNPDSSKPKPGTRLRVR